MNLLNQIRSLVRRLQRVKTKTKVFFILGLLVTVLTSIYLYNFIFSQSFIKNGIKYTRNWRGQIVESESMSQSKIQYSNPQENIEVTIWEIVDTSENINLPTGINYYQSPTDVVKWNNYLIGFTKDYYLAKSGGAFFGSTGGPITIHSTLRHIRILNLTTNEVYSISLQKPAWGEIDYITPQIIDDNYFLTLSGIGPRSPSLQYQLKLPPSRNSTITKLEKSLGSVYKYGNVFVGVFCYEGCSFEKININTLQTSNLKRLNEASNEYNTDRVEKFIGFTNNGEMVLENTKTKEKIAVSIADEKTERRFSLDESLINPYEEVKNQTIKESFDSLKLDPRYTLTERRINLLK